MDSVARSSHRRKHSTTAANIFSSSFSFKNPYGDLLLSNGGDRKSLQVHEYSEIFSGSSSIPVLDLSGLDERAGSGDSRSSKLDYTNIFGGLTHDEVFVPYEELLKTSAKKAKTRTATEKKPSLQESGSRHSSKKTEMPHGVASDQSVDGFKMQESGSLSSTVKTVRPFGVASDQSVYGVKQQESDSPHPSRKRETPSGAASDQSVDEVKQQLSMPFSRTNERDSDATDANTHTTQLNSVPGFTHSVDGNQSNRRKNDRPPLPKREISRAWSFSAEVEPASSKGGLSFEKLRVHDKLHNANEVNIKPQSSPEPLPSSYPSNPSDIKEPRQSRASSFVADGNVSRKITGESFEEFDDNSADAVSAATLKKAIEQAQESIRIAKMIMERKKDGYQDGPKSRPISSPKVADRETKIEAFGAKDSNYRKRYVESDPTHPVLAGIDGKLTPSFSHSGVDVWENSETNRIHGETVAGGCKLFASNHIKSEATHVADNVSLEKLERKVEAAEDRREVKNLSGCEAFYLEPTEVGNVNFETGQGKLEVGKEDIDARNVTSNHTKGSEVVPELLKGAINTSRQTQAVEKSLEDEESCHARLYQAEVPEDNEGRALNSSKRISENCNAVDEASKNSKIGQETGVTEQRENVRNSKEQHENKLEECDQNVNERPEFDNILKASCNSVGNGSLDQEEIKKKTVIVSELQVDDWRHAKTSDEDIKGGRQTESHLWRDNKELLEEPLLEVFNEEELDVFPEVGEFGNKADEDNEPQINDYKQRSADNGDEPKSPEELILNHVEEEHVETSKCEAAETIMMEESHCGNFQKRETCGETDKMDNTLCSSGEGEDHDKFQSEAAAYDDDRGEDVGLSSSEANIIFDAVHTNKNIIAETHESCHVESSSNVEDQKSFQSSEENMPKSNGAVSAVDSDKMTEKSFSLQDDEILRTNYLHRSASEEIFVDNKLHYAYEGLPSDSRTEAVDVLDSDPEENLSEDSDVSKTTNDIHVTSQEYDTKINMQDMSDILGSHVRTSELDHPDVEKLLEQTIESDEGSLSVSSFEKIDEFSAQESEECTGNVEDLTPNKEELRDETVSDERTCAGELSDGLYSESYDQPKETIKPLETEATVDTDVHMEKDKENHAGMPPMEESDAKEGVQNLESNDQQQRIEAIKRGREREKDRIAVERAIREARERAFAEVRERAERAAVERAATEVRQRATIDGREKVDKASVVKQPVDKAAIEAKLRAERAAVERATAEARQRALEKAKSQKISDEWRTPADRHSTERHSSSSRNNVLKHSYSSSDLETGTDSESAQRRKARLERHQRIMERAAKALTEKNMRDLLAQKEQAERNRLAESLDADIKRWATGKEGNLRALLSTLQYILGPDSGWQPVSLTEIITTAAVKKAYRKATLCVHPDKLQQRRASVQQKYVCEKVFDLLKAAWNRFNSDER